jgi:hypothetical protein
MGVYPHRVRPMRTVRLKPVLLFSLTLSALASTPLPAFAAEPTPSEISVARRLFDEGKAAEDAGRWREAAEKFRRAAAIKDTAGLRFHLARCEEEQGALVEALVEYDRASELIERGAKAADVEKLLPEAREKVRAKLAHVTLKLPEGVANVSVELDGKALSPSVMGVPLPLNPGSHRLRAMAPGRKSFVADFALQTGEAKQVLLEMPRDATVPEPGVVPAPPVAAERRAPEADSGISTRGLVLVGEGSLFVAALTTGIVFSIKRSAATDRYEAANRIVLQQIDDPVEQDSACRMSLPGCAELTQAQDDRAQAGTLATVGFAVAGASAAAFALTYWLWPQESASGDVAIGAGPGNLGLSASGRF